MDRYFSVTQVNNYIKRLFEDDALLSEIQVKGELSNFKRHNSGHLYFTLKDAQASINCVMFASYAHGLAWEPKSGDKVIVNGNISIYEKTGQYQLYAINMKPLGEGDHLAAFIRLRDALQKEGLFDRKKPLPSPEQVSCVALVTSPTGAAVQDMIKVIQGRNPSVKIVIVPALVQGENAAVDLVRAIQTADEWGKAEVIIVGRGGGSVEDLQAFNEEIVARAIAACVTPIISAVGHETDITIADFVADLRAPTPSAAAVAAVADLSELFLKADYLRKRADRAVVSACLAARNRLNMLDIERLVNSRIDKYKNALQSRSQLLEKLSPYALWKRGYSVVCAEDGAVLRSVAAVNLDQNIKINMQDGEVSARVLSVQKNRG